ncbi:MAG: transposase [Phycisphaerae bacterium]
MQKEMSFKPNKPKPSRLNVRAKPASGILEIVGKPTIVLVTVCTKNRKRVLHHDGVHGTLVSIWRQCNSWRVGRYVIMPDHIHLFVAPTEQSVPFENWVRYWKSRFTKTYRSTWRWQSGHWDTRIRSREHYIDRCDYVFLNPVRHELVRKAEEWEFRGEVYPIDW